MPWWQCFFMSAKDNCERWASLCEAGEMSSKMRGQTSRRGSRDSADVRMTTYSLALLPPQGNDGAHPSRQRLQLAGVRSSQSWQWRFPWIQSGGLWSGLIFYNSPGDLVGQWLGYLTVPWRQQITQLPLSSSAPSPSGLCSVLLQCTQW